MPGRYTEPTSRAQPLNDPRCANLTQTDSGGAKTPSYRYQVTCPNDQNLVYVQGRAVSRRAPPQPPLTNRQGIPDLGPCVRCNLQLEGTGVLPTDVIIDGASDYESGDAEARPRTLHKHVIMRADRADGFVAHNFTARGALEHGIYIEETDGYRIDTVKMFWAADYGNLTFTSDHGLYTDCDGFGAGDAVLYPGAAPETGEQADLSFYPDAPRINTTVRRVRHARKRARLLGLDGQRRADHQQPHLRQHRRDLDRHHLRGRPSRLPGGQRPGGPQLHLLEQPGPVRPNPPVDPVVGILPSGVGIFWAGHNNGRVHDNWIWDNWRDGALLLSIPDFLVTPEGNINPGGSCKSDPREPALSTSCGNRYYDNHLGRVPQGLQAVRRPLRLRQQRGPDPRRREERRGLLVGRGRPRHRRRATAGSTTRAPTAPTASVTGSGVGDGNDSLPSDCTSTAAATG